MILAIEASLSDEPLRLNLKSTPSEVQCQTNGEKELEELEAPYNPFTEETLEELWLQLAAECKDVDTEIPNSARDWSESGAINL